MMNIRILLGLIPETLKYENERDSLFEEYGRFLQYEKSDELAEYLRLKEEVHSLAFKNKVNVIKSQKFKTTPEYEKEREYLALKNSGDIKMFYKFKGSGGPEWIASYEKSAEFKEIEKTEKYINSNEFIELKKELSRPGKDRYKETSSYKKLEEYYGLKKDPDVKKYIEIDGQLSDEITKKVKTFKKLEELVLSDEFINEKKQIEKSSFKTSQEYNVLQHLNNLKKGSDYKKYTGYLKSKQYLNYVNLNKSDRVKNFETQEKYINSEKFTKVKGYMLLSASEKYNLSDEAKKVQAYNVLDKSDIIKWYLKVKKMDKFKAIKTLDKTFEDNFEDKKPEPKKWMTRYFWGNALMKSSYSLSTDKHFITDGKNIEVKDSVLSIVTKQENVTGKAWDKEYGFFDKNFNFTSGLISTGSSFRQKYGLFEAKIKISPSYPVNHAFWMVGDKMLPHIDIIKYSKWISVNNFWLNGSEKVHKKVSWLYPKKLTTGYFIYSLEWKPGKITWKINGVPVTSTNAGIPEEPMYINFSSGIQNDKDLTSLPAKLEIDWIRCYQFKD